MSTCTFVNDLRLHRGIIKNIQRQGYLHPHEFRYWQPIPIVEGGMPLVAANAGGTKEDPGLIPSLLTISGRLHELYSSQMGIRVTVLYICLPFSTLRGALRVVITDAGKLLDIVQ